MKHFLFTRALLVAALMSPVAACGQKGPLVAPPEGGEDVAQESAAPSDVPQDEATIEETDEQY